jgi:iron complex transport system substrate-binding protein
MNFLTLGNRGTGLAIPVLALVTLAASFVPASALTIVDEAGRTIELDKPIERVAVIGNYNVDIVAAIGARDRIVGVTGRDLKQYQIAGGKWDSSYNVGEWGQVNYEAIVKNRSGRRDFLCKRWLGRT